MPLYRTDAGVVFFVHIPKTGGTSIEKTLRNAGAAQAMKVKKKLGYAKATMQHMQAEIYLEAVGDGFADYTFTIVRNPYDRFLSEYKMKVIEPGLDGSVHDWAAANFKRHGEFAFTRDNHIRPQVDFLSERVEIFKFEDGLQAPLAAACKHLDLEVPELRHEKKGARGLFEVSEETIELIQKFYREDFSELNYDLDDFGKSFAVVE